MKLAKTSIAVLVIQLAIVSSIAGKYLYQRWTCPRVWTRTVVYDPELLMRGRYLSLHLSVDGCDSKPSFMDDAFAKQGSTALARKTMVFNGLVVNYPARLKVENNRLVAARVADSDNDPGALMVRPQPGSTCSDLMLTNMVDFYIPEHAITPSEFGAGHELWIEVTVPPKGPPRPLQLANKENGVWKPLKF